MIAHARSLLAELGCQSVLDSSSVSEALVTLQDMALAGTPINIILSDHHMAGFNGLQFLKSVRTNRQLKDTVFITASTEASREVIIPYVESGADGYILKPMKKEDLVAKVQNACKKRKLAP